MSKDTFYFPHDYEPTSDPKIQALIGEYGATGYGIYWRIIEMLHSDINHKLPLKKYVFLAIAKQMLASVEQIEAIINYCITPCELLVSDSENLWSIRVMRNIEVRAQLSEKRAIAGRAGAIAKQNLTKSSRGKKSKGKERKENNNSIEARESKFNSEVEIHKDKYPKEMLEAFINYWTEKNPSRTKMRWETQETFEIPRRLTSWASREKDQFTKKEEVVVPNFSRPIPSDLKSILSNDR